MPFFNLDVLKGKPTKSIGIMPHLKLSKSMFLGQRNFLKNKKQKLQLIWIYENMVKYGLLTI
jgi:hypothetical protein